MQSTLSGGFPIRNRQDHQSRSNHKAQGKSRSTACTWLHGGIEHTFLASQCRKCWGGHVQMQTMCKTSANAEKKTTQSCRQQLPMLTLSTAHSVAFLVVPDSGQAGTLIRQWQQQMEHDLHLVLRLALERQNLMWMSCMIVCGTSPITPGPITDHHMALGHLHSADNVFVSDAKNEFLAEWHR